MKWFLGTYTARFNRRHTLFGHLFSGRYKASLVDGSGNGYLKTVCDHVHLNPARAKLLKPEQALRGYRWSSWPEYLKAPSKRWPWSRVDRLLGEYRIPKDSAAGRHELERATMASGACSNSARNCASLARNSAVRSATRCSRVWFSRRISYSAFFCSVISRGMTTRRIESRTGMAVARFSRGTTVPV